MRILIGCIFVAILAGCGDVTATALATSSGTPLPYPTGTAMATPFRVDTPTPLASTPPPIPSAVMILATTPTGGAQVVTVQGSDRVNVRVSAGPTAAVIALFGAGADMLVIGPDTTGDDGMRWVHVQAGDRDGYVRSDLVSGPHASSGVIPTPVFLATRTMALGAPMMSPVVMLVPTAMPVAPAVATAAPTQMAMSVTASAIAKPTLMVASSPTMPTMAATAPKVGTVVPLKNWDITITSVEKPGMKLNGATAVGQFLVVNLTLKNTGNENFGFNSFDFNLRTATNAKINQSNDFSLAGYNSSHGGTTASQIPPGAMVKYVAVFDVADVNGLTLEFQGNAQKIALQ